MIEEFDVIVIGLGHAGCEASLASSRMGCKTLGLTINLDNIGLMPCNPAVGGPGKSHLVREIDALGGQMGLTSDESLLHTRMLNLSRGPAVHSIRAQINKLAYHTNMRFVLENTPNLTIRQEIVTEILTKNNIVHGIKTLTNNVYYTNSVIVATGTYLDSRIIIGDRTKPGGPHNQITDSKLSQSIRNIGIITQRLQTATPARIQENSIDYSVLSSIENDFSGEYFSFDNLEKDPNQFYIPSYITYTNDKTVEIVKKNIHRSPLKLKNITDNGPRYCPSIDRKVINFPEKTEHQIFIEPEGTFNGEMYLQGVSTALPYDVQRDLIQSCKGMENAKVVRAGYAIEYDSILPYQLEVSLQVKGIQGLYSCGQINGTSGYEEAAAQGLISGINSALFIKGKSPLILNRSEAYIGVMIDDLINKELLEPYRMFTARAEYRLLLRQGNADMRLSETGNQVGLLNPERYNRFKQKKQIIESELSKLEAFSITPKKEVVEIYDQLECGGIRKPETGIDFICRKNGSIQNLKQLGYERSEILSKKIEKEVEIVIKYKGYLDRMNQQIDLFKRNENILVPENFDYHKLKGITREAKERLTQIKPLSIGQASRISGISPCDIQIIMVHIKNSTTKED